jgi:hypothetical protein
MLFRSACSPVAVLHGYRLSRGTLFYAIRVYGEAGKCDRDAEHTGDFKEWYEVFLRERNGLLR